jgi:hypothetical protein
VAAGAFAPGHLGELTRVVPFELVDAVLEETCARERRLPSRVGVYFLLAMCLFPRPGYLGVRGKLRSGPSYRPVPAGRATRFTPDHQQWRPSPRRQADIPPKPGASTIGNHALRGLTH